MKCEINNRKKDQFVQKVFKGCLLIRRKLILGETKKGKRPIPGLSGRVGGFVQAL